MIANWAVQQWLWVLECPLEKGGTEKHEILENNSVWYTVMQRDKKQWKNKWGTEQFLLLNFQSRKDMLNKEKRHGLGRETCHMRCKEHVLYLALTVATWTAGTKSCSAPLCKASPPEFRSLCLPMFFWCFYSRLVPGGLSWRMLWDCYVLQNLPLKLFFYYTANNSIRREELSWLSVSWAFSRRESLLSCALLVLEW